MMLECKVDKLLYFNKFYLQINNIYFKMNKNFDIHYI